MADRYSFLTIGSTDFSPYFPPRGSVNLDLTRAGSNGFNIQGKRYYVFAEDISGNLMTIEPPENYGIDKDIAEDLLALWLATGPSTFSVIENYTTLSGNKKTWTNCVFVEQPTLTPRDGAKENKDLFYSYKLAILLGEGTEEEDE